MPEKFGFNLNLIFLNTYRNRNLLIPPSHPRGCASTSSSSAYALYICIFAVRMRTTVKCVFWSVNTSRSPYRSPRHCRCVTFVFIAWLSQVCCGSSVRLHINIPVRRFLFFLHYLHSLLSQALTLSDTILVSQVITCFKIPRPRPSHIAITVIMAWPPTDYTNILSTGSLVVRIWRSHRHGRGSFPRLGTKTGIHNQSPSTILAK